jgi:hypothetical protein
VHSRPPPGPIDQAAFERACADALTSLNAENFVGVRKIHKPLRVIVHGLKNFCRRLPPLLQSAGWEIRHHGIEDNTSLCALAHELRRADLVYTWGGRLTLGKFLWTARTLRKESLVMFWSGTDVLYGRDEYERGQMHSWVAGKIHWAGAPWLAEEVRAMGLPCEYVPSTWVLPVEGQLSLPEKFCVLVYLPAIDRTELYGIDQVLSVAGLLPDVQFTLVGLPEGRLANSPPNLRYAYRVTDMASLYRQSTVVWRPVKHDGLSFMVLEGLAHGRHVLWSYPFEACVHVSNPTQAHAELRRLQEMHRRKVLQINSKGIELVARHFTPECIRENILKRWREIIVSGKGPRSGRGMRSGHAVTRHVEI